MSKITFRADDDLVERLEAFDASKSEVMREALRSYLDEAESSDASDAPGAAGGVAADGLEGAIAERVDAIIDDRLDAALDDRLHGRAGSPIRGYGPAPRDRDINVNVTVDGATTDHPSDEGSTAPVAEPSPERESSADETDVTADGPAADGPTATDADGERTCGGCGGTLDAGDVYCANCGEKTAHRMFCECGDEVRTDWGFCPGCGRRTPAADVLDTR